MKDWQKCFIPSWLEYRLEARNSAFFLVPSLATMSYTSPSVLEPPFPYHEPQDSPIQTKSQSA